jgi:hypothetical protein
MYTTGAHLHCRLPTLWVFCHRFIRIIFTIRMHGMTVRFIAVLAISIREHFGA